jgi:hydrogenase maturation factor
MLPSGKLPRVLMKRLLATLKNTKDVHVGPKLGQDTAILDLGEQFLVVKSNPVTFATDEIGFYAVTLNANDVAMAGAHPKWFSSTILLPEKSTDEAMCENIFSEIAQECQNLGVSVIGGHTEVTIGLDRPIIAGTMMGILPKEKKDTLVTTMGAKPGDRLLLIKEIAIEGTAIIAREKEGELVAQGISAAVIEKGKKYLHQPGISVVREALLLAENFPIHAMHGPTEGGFSMGVVEMLENSECGVLLESDRIPILPETKILCTAYDLNPLQTIASGCLLVAVASQNVLEIITFLENEGIRVSEIGQITDEPGKYHILNSDGIVSSLSYSPVDEITKIF